MKQATVRIATTQTAVQKSIEIIPLRQLVLSPNNMRTPDMNENELDELGANILARGLNQNLSVHIMGSTKQSQEPIYGVCVGGNRLYALNRLLDAGKITADFEVECRIVEEKHALEISIAENALRKSPHVVDQFYAYKRLVDQGEHIDDIAAVFRVSPIVVKRALSLANLAPSLLIKCRLDEIKYSQLKVLTLIKTHDEQIAFWESRENEYQRKPETMRSYLTEQRIDAATHPLAKFVGVKAYTDANGPMESDLFSDSDNAGFMLDSALLDSLALDKLEEYADEYRRNGWLWVETSLEFGYQDRWSYGSAPYSIRDINDAEKARLDAINEELEAIENAEQWSDELEEKQNQLENEAAAITQATHVYEDESKSISGVVLTVSEHGTLEPFCGLIRRVEKGAANSEETQTAMDATTTEAPKKVTSDYSEAMYRRLTAHRTRALQAGIAGNPSVALALLAYRLSASLFYPRERLSCSAQIRLETTNLESYADDIEINAGTAMLTAAHDALKNQLPKKLSAFLPWLIEQPANVITDILAYCTAASINDVRGNDGRNSEVDTLAQAIGLNMADYWTATASSFFNHVTKRHALDALKTVSKKAAEECEDLKKDALAREAEQQLADKHWLPKVLQFKRKK